MTSPKTLEFIEKVEVLSNRQKKLQGSLDDDLERLDARNSASPLIRKFLDLHGLSRVSELDHEGRSDLTVHLVNSMEPTPKKQSELQS